jgi:protein required for attachment to host cells
MIDYYISLPDRFAAAIEEDQNREMSLINNLVIITDRYKQGELNKEINSKLDALIKGLEKQMGS